MRPDHKPGLLSFKGISVSLATMAISFFIANGKLRGYAPLVECRQSPGNHGAIEGGLHYGSISRGPSGRFPRCVRLENW
jgi:hypothetical protein